MDVYFWCVHSVVAQIDEVAEGRGPFIRHRPRYVIDLTRFPLKNTKLTPHVTSLIQQSILKTKTETTSPRKISNGFC